MQTLAPGAAGAEVSLLQLGLDRAGYGPLTLDGIFGAATERALRAFQRSYGLPADGVAGPRTEAALAPWYRGYAVHTVARGDSLWSIAGRYDASLTALETANPALDPFALEPGQRLVVPFPFPVVPTIIPWCSALVEYCVQGIEARYPMLRREIIGRSVRGKPLYALSMGEGRRRVLYTAAHHANEWITAPLLMQYAEALLGAWAAGESIGGAPAREILSSVRITLIPMVDPDGVDLVTGALPPVWRQRAEAIARTWPKIPFPEGWKANIRGTDLNLQYPAGWDTAREIKAALGVTAPAPRDYVGPAPLTAPESAALAAFTRRLDPDLVLAYHTQGETIYWQYRGAAPAGARELGERLALASGYALEETPYASAWAGYKDWFIAAFDRPGFTIEAGAGENPLPLAAYPQIWEKNAPLLTAAALG